jgi:hypothetical protein
VNDRLQAHAEITIARNCDDVWARIRDFGDTSWVPNVESCTLVGEDRTIRMQGRQFELVERLTAHSEEHRSYSFCVVGEVDLQPLFGPGHVLRDLRATLSVAPAGASSARVTWAVETEPFVLDGTAAEYQGALENLKTLLER